MIEDGQSIVHATTAQKRAMLQQSFDRAREYLQAFCTASQQPPFQMLNGMPVRYTLRRQTKTIPERLIDKFKQVLKCSNYVTFKAPLNPEAEGVVEDT